jgi:hypothetical protein
MKLLKRVAMQRLRGDNPSALQAFAAAVMVGAAAGVITYKLLRS